MPAKIPGLREDVEAMAARLGVTYKSAYAYYFRCKKYGVDYKTYAGGCIEGMPKRKYIKTKETIDKSRVLKVRDEDGTIKEYRTVLTLSEQKALLVTMILNKDTKDTDKLKALDMYNAISPENNINKNASGRYELIIKDYKKEE